VKRGVIRVGISGWTYAPWRRVFYPPELPQRSELQFAADRFSTIEVNTTFYAQPTLETYRAWRSQVPASFVFALKGPRAITHELRLQDTEPALAAFFRSGILELGPHLGPILWQLPGNMRFDAGRMEAFLNLLPRTTAAASALCQGFQQHSAIGSGGAVAVTEERSRRLRHAFEVRHESFMDPEFLELLRTHGAAVACCAETGLPALSDVTADFVYCRLMGGVAGEEGGYDADTLSQWVERAKTWAMGAEPADFARIGGRPSRQQRDVFVFLDTATRLRAPANALEMIRRIRA
jgi:uncharacterized protein YecE (DUF72 family)